MQTGPHRVAEEDAIDEEEDKVIIYPRGFNITWGNDDRYWRIDDWPTKSSVAELKQVSWLEVTCSTDKQVFVGNKYRVGFVVTMRSDAFGWKDVNVYVMAKVGKSGSYSFKKVCLGNKDPDKELVIPEDNDPLEITVKLDSKASNKPDQKSSPPEIHFGLYEVWNKKWKGGLKIHQAFIQKVITDPENGHSSKPTTSNT